MAAPNFVAQASNAGVSNSATVVIPTSGVTTGMRVLLTLTLTPSAPNADPSGFTLVDDTFDEPTLSGGRMYLWTATITSGSTVDPGDTVTVALAGSSRWALAVAVYQASAVETGAGLGKYAPVPGYNGDDPIYTLASPGATATDDCRAVHIYGVNATVPNPAAVTWTPDAATTERVDVSSLSATSRNATILIADETVTGAGATPARTALSTQRVQPTAYTVLLIVNVDRPTATPDADISVAAGGTFTLGVTAADGGGAGAPYTYQWTQVAGTTTALDDDEAQAPEGTAGSAAEVLEYEVVVTDDDDVDSLPAIQRVTVLGASDTAVPTTDVTVAGWTKEPSGAPSVSSVLDDPGDADYAEYASPSGAVLEVELSEVNEPTGDEPFTVTVRASLVAGTAGQVVTRLKQGASTVIASWTDNWSTATSVQQFDHVLTSGQVASVTDWGDLRLRFEVTAT